MQICGEVLWGVGKCGQEGKTHTGELARSCRWALKTVSGQGQGAGGLTLIITGCESLGGGESVRDLQVSSAFCCLYRQAMWVQLLGSSLPAERCRCRCRCPLLEMEAHQYVTGVNSAQKWSLCWQAIVEHGQHLNSTMVTLGCMGLIARWIIFTTIAILHEREKRSAEHRSMWSALLTINPTVELSLSTSGILQEGSHLPRNINHNINHYNNTLSVTKVIFWLSVLLPEYVLISSEVRGLCDIIYWSSNLKN